MTTGFMRWCPTPRLILVLIGARHLPGHAAESERLCRWADGQGPMRIVRRLGFGKVQRSIGPESLGLQNAGRAGLVPQSTRGRDDRSQQLFHQPGSASGPPLAGAPGRCGRRRPDYHDPAHRKRAHRVLLYGPELHSPKKVRVQYRLRNSIRPGWTPETIARSFITTSKPGHYRFRIQACNADGIWNTTGDSVDIELPPPFYETAWFQAFLLLVAALALSAPIDGRSGTWRCDSGAFRPKRPARSQGRRTDGRTGPTNRLCSAG